MRDFHGQNLRGHSFRNRDLTGTDFSSCDLCRADFSKGDLTEAKFYRTKLGITWSRSTGLLLFSLVLGVVAGFLSAFGNVELVFLFQVIAKQFATTSTENALYTYRVIYLIGVL